jgi:Lrp/AsnC family transcriptional regulator for asnA, asnC and gidA
MGYDTLSDMIDDLDKRIIAELVQDARQTSTRISRKLGVSDTTVRHRIYRLKEQKVIDTTVVPDAAKFGYSVIALIALQVDLGSIDTVAQELSTHPNVHYIAECTGAYDMFIGVWLESTQRLAQFIKEFVAKFPSIRSSETFMIMNVYKNDAGWLQSSEQ